MGATLKNRDQTGTETDESVALLTWQQTKRPLIIILFCSITVLFGNAEFGLKSGQQFRMSKFALVKKRIAEIVKKVICRNRTAKTFNNL